MFSDILYNMWFQSIISNYTQDVKNSGEGGEAKIFVHSFQWAMGLYYVFMLSAIANIRFTENTVNIESHTMIYRKVSNIRRTKSQKLNDSRLVFQLSLPNPLKPGVKSRMKM